MAKVYYNQMDSRWVNHPYTSANHPTATCGTSGCGPTCAAMLISSSRETIYPDQMCNISKENGFRALEGTSDELFSYVANRWGLEMVRLHSSFEAHDYCKKGYFVIIACGTGLWTTGGHYIIAVGANDTEIEIYDPYLYNGKFNQYGRQGKVRLNGVSAWVEINTFKQYSNAQRFFAFKVNDVQPTPPQPKPQEKQMYVNTQSLPLNVRNTPNGTIVDTLPKGTEVTVYEEQGGWSRIGDNRWVSSQYLAAKSVNPQPSYSYPLGRYKVAASGLNVRTGPSTSYGIKKTYPNGTVFDTFEINGSWARTPSGWVCLDYCKLLYRY